MESKSVCIKTLGCSANQSDSEIMAGILTRAGFTIVQSEANADIVIFNTCFVKTKTENKCRLCISELAKSGKPLIVAGCLAQSRPEIVRELAPKASLIGTRAVTKIADVVTKTLEDSRVEELGESGEKICVPKIRRNPVIDIVQISEGCLGSCSFCCTKSARGNLSSYSAEDIVKEILAAKAAGCKEFWLTSQDCGAWGMDSEGNLPSLLKKITAEVKGKYFLRVGMANPTYLKKFANELVNAFAHPNIFKFLHIPVQSGSDKILADMRRGHTAQDFSDIIKKFRTTFPQIQVWTDMIVGYPTESEEDFRKSMELIERTRPSFVNISKFRSRPGTEAAKLEPLPRDVVLERSARMSELARKIILDLNRDWLGWSGPVLIDEFNRKKQSWLGRNFAYKPIVVKGKQRLGDIVDVRIIDAGNVLIGEIIQTR